MKKAGKLVKICLETWWWFLLLLLTDAAFAFLLWVVDAEGFLTLAGLMGGLTLTLYLTGVFITCKKEAARESALLRFWEDPDELNEQRAVRELSVSGKESLHRTAVLLRDYESLRERQRLNQADYEEYIEAWAHEFKHPLSLMTLLLDHRKEEMSPAVYRRMEYVYGSMQVSVDQILYYARLKTVRKDYCLEVVSVRECLEETVSDYRYMLGDEDIRLDWKLVEEPVLTDRKGLRFMLGQLLSNAVKYRKRDAGGSVISFELHRSRDNLQIELSIRDNGMGIRESDLPFVMEKGFTGDCGRQKIKSTGMGLYLVRQMAQDLKMTVEIDSVFGEGTAITLIFPAVEV